jgi:hypothetical protein
LAAPFASAAKIIMPAGSPAPDDAIPAPRVERRRSPRYLCSHLFEISGAGAPGMAVLEDLCPEGAGIAADFPASPDDPVTLNFSGLLISSRVRYCYRRENDFRLGLEFTGGYRWRIEHWQPDHFFLPPAHT